jgi:alkylated DNA repair dioxygenase AlkB
LPSLAWSRRRFTLPNKRAPVLSSPFLFGDDEPELPPIPGLAYVAEYITPAEEQAFAAAIDQGEWDTSWERRRQLFGGSYGSHASTTRAIPAWGQALAQRLLEEGLTAKPFDHLLVNEYLPGQGIAMHVDYEPYDRTVVSLSLLAPCVMDFRHVEAETRHSWLLARRSLLVLSDDARYHWQHGIARRKNDRWQGRVIPRARRLSITFRSRKEP